MKNDSEGFPGDGDGSTPPSRSARRRQALAVFDLAETLVGLSPAQSQTLPLPEGIAELVAESRAITAHIARKRQLQFLAKQLRAHEEQLPAVYAALQHHQDHERRQTARLHEIEAWRERLIAEGDGALTVFLQHFPDCDRQALRQLVHKARREREQEKPPAAARALFRLLRGICDAHAPGQASASADG